MRISNETFIKIKATLPFKAIPHRRHDGKLIAGFNHVLEDGEKVVGAVGSLQAATWLIEDVEMAESIILLENPDCDDLDSAVLKKFSH